MNLITGLEKWQGAEYWWLRQKENHLQRSGSREGGGTLRMILN